MSCNTDSDSSTASKDGHSSVSKSSTATSVSPTEGGVKHHTESTDVLIVGAGPVGLMLALRLAQSDIRSIIIEKEERLNQNPRAIGYYGPVHMLFQEAGIYDQVYEEGLACAGYAWRKPLADDDKGGKTLGEVVASNYMGQLDKDGRYKIGTCTIQLAQNQLGEILLERALKTGNVKIQWGCELTGISPDQLGVTASMRIQGTSTAIRAKFLAGCDGGRSTVRKQLGIRFSGHSWPERFIATDVLRTPTVIPEIPVHFVIDPEYWAVVTPLEKAQAGVRTRWRYSMAVSNSALSDEEIMTPEFVDSLLLRQIDGPRPSDHEVVSKSLYKMHQLLASTMYRSRCFLAGDAAHLNNPIGGLGLCTGLLDADALHQTLVIAFCAGAHIDKPLSAETECCFQQYSAERRMVFSRVIHPLSSENKVRLHGSPVESATNEDWYLQALRTQDKEALAKIHKPLSETWRTTMKDYTSKESSPALLEGKPVETTTRKRKKSLVQRMSALLSNKHVEQRPKVEAY